MPTVELRLLETLEAPLIVFHGATAAPVAHVEGRSGLALNVALLVDAQTSRELAAHPTYRDGLPAVTERSVF